MFIVILLNLMKNKINLFPSKLENISENNSPMPSITLPNFDSMPTVHIKQNPSPYNNNQNTRLSHDPSLLY
jgi:hypothetical protein